MKIGLIINPIAGMGGQVGLKGTDGDAYQKATALGAIPLSADRTRMVLEVLREHPEIDFLAAPGSMGADLLTELHIPHQTTGVAKPETTREDTLAAARAMRDNGVSLIVFAGGDGTARDIYEAVGTSVPVVGIPAGVKIYSGIFAYTPGAAAELVEAFLAGAATTAEEVLDIDEDAYREGRLSSRLYGELLVPDVRRHVQAGKVEYTANPTASENKVDIADWVIEKMEPDTLYLLGPGSTVQAITDFLGEPKTLLGIDAMLDRKVIARDLNEQQILGLLKKHKRACIIVTPLGGNGFIIGRGSKPFSPAVLNRVGRNNLMVICTKEKLEQLDCLHVDSGDTALDKQLAGYIQVTHGYMESRMVRISAD